MYIKFNSTEDNVFQINDTSSTTRISSPWNQPGALLPWSKKQKADIHHIVLCQRQGRHLPTLKNGNYLIFKRKFEEICLDIGPNNIAYATVS